MMDTGTGILLRKRGIWQFTFDSHQRLHGKDNVAIKRYVISFWNGIDLRYKLLKDPGVKISIAGIIISRVCYSTNR